MNGRVLKVAQSEEDLYAKLDELTEAGYDESEIHVLSKNQSHLRMVKKYTSAQVHELGSMKNKLMSMFSTDDSLGNSLEGVNFTDEELHFINNGLDQGGIILFCTENTNDSELQREERYMSQDQYRDSTTAGNNSTSHIPFNIENNFDEPIDRFRRGETFQNDAIRVNDVDHISSSMQEDPMVQKSRESLFASEEVHSDNYSDDNTEVADDYQWQDEQSPGVDPNLGPAPFGADETFERQAKRHFNQNL